MMLCNSGSKVVAIEGDMEMDSAFGEDDLLSRTSSASSSSSVITIASSSVVPERLDLGGGAS